MISPFLLFIFILYLFFIYFNHDSSKYLRVFEFTTFFDITYAKNFENLWEPYTICEFVFFWHLIEVFFKKSLNVLVIPSTLHIGLLLM